MSSQAGLLGYSEGLKFLNHGDGVLTEGTQLCFESENARHGGVGTGSNGAHARYSPLPFKATVSDFVSWRGQLLSLV